MSPLLEVLVAEDQTVFRDALCALLEQVGYLVCGTASTLADLVEAVRVRQPGVCLTEQELPGGDVIGVVGELLAASPLTRVVILTSQRDPDTMHHALQAGAVGFVHKTRGLTVLLDVLERIVAGEVVVEGSFLRPSPAAPSAPVEGPWLAAYLTGRETQCLGMLVAGLDTTGMALRLGVSPTTIRSHVQAVLVKLGVHSRLEAAALAVRYGLVPVADQHDDPGIARRAQQQLL